MAVPCLIHQHLVGQLQLQMQQHCMHFTNVSCHSKQSSHLLVLTSTGWLLQHNVLICSHAQHSNAFTAAAKPNTCDLAPSAGTNLGKNSMDPNPSSAAATGQRAQPGMQQGPELLVPVGGRSRDVGTEDAVRTIFITGFPQGVKERELHNLVRYLPGYEASQATRELDAQMTQKGTGGSPGPAHTSIPAYTVTSARTANCLGYYAAATNVLPANAAGKKGKGKGRKEKKRKNCISSENAPPHRSKKRGYLRPRHRAAKIERGCSPPELTFTK
eukprot:1156080-Pelagomonas_calceolata.AAC.1